MQNHNSNCKSKLKEINFAFHQDKYKPQIYLRSVSYFLLKSLCQKGLNRQNSAMFITHGNKIVEWIIKKRLCMTLVQMIEIFIWILIGGLTKNINIEFEFEWIGALHLIV